MKINRLQVFTFTFTLLTTNIVMPHLNTYAKENKYFEKIMDLEEPASIDDIILTLEERNLQTSNSLNGFSKELIRNLLENKSEAGLKTITIDALNVERYFYPTFLSNAITHEVQRHTYTELYDSINDSIYWKKLFNIVKENNKKYQEQNKKNMMNEDRIIKTNEYEPLTDEELKLVLKYIEKFVTNIKKEKTDLDMKNLACKLKQLVLGYELDYENTDVLASTLYTTILFPLNEGCYPDLEEMESTVDHEVKHFIDNPCIDERHDDISISSPGISIKGIYLFEYTPFSWDFIGEAYAEKYPSELMNYEPKTYPKNRYLVETLEMVNSFIERDIGLLCDYSMEHNPIGMLQQFLVLGDNDTEQQQWLLQNAIMLECYNVLSSPMEAVMYTSSIEDKYGIETSYRGQDENEDSILLSDYGWNEIHTGLLNEANLHLLRLGLAGIALNVENSRDLTPEDCLYLAKLLSYRIEQHSLKTQEILGFEVGDNNSYLEEKNKLLEDFSYYIYRFRRVGYTNYTFDDVNLDTYVLSNAFTIKEKEYYSNLYKDLCFGNNIEKEKIYRKLGEK